MPKRLRSSYSSFLPIPELCRRTKGDCAFAVRVPKLWNALLEEIRSAVVINHIKLFLTPDLDDFSFVLWIKILLILCKVLFNSFQRCLINYLHLPLLMIIMTYNTQNIFVQASSVCSWDHSAWPKIYFNFILLSQMTRFIPLLNLVFLQI